MSRRLLRALLFSLPAAALYPAPALAQVNTEALRSDLESHPYYFAVQASFAGHIGNTNGVVGSGAAFAGGTFGRHLVLLKVQGDYAAFAGATTLSKAFAHARYNLAVLPYLFVEAFAQVEEDRFERLALRQVDGLGVRVAILRRAAVGLHIGTAWMMDYEKLDGEYVFMPGPAWFAERWSNYVSVSWKMNDRTRLSNAFYIQPRFGQFGDYRLLDNAALVVDIDKRFSAKVECLVHHNSTPPANVLPTDVDTTTSLVLTL